MMAEALLSKRKAKAPFCQYFEVKSKANRESDNSNEGKGVVYLTEKLEVCSLLPELII